MNLIQKLLSRAGCLNRSSHNPDPFIALVHGNQRIDETSKWFMFHVQTMIAQVEVYNLHYLPVDCCREDFRTV